MKGEPYKMASDFELADSDDGFAGFRDVTSQVSAGSQGRPSASMTRVSKKCLPCFAAVER